MKQGLCEGKFFAKGQVDDMPLYKRKTPLQKAIQLLKWHRNQMFKNNDDSQPISIVITTLAARAFQGELDLEIAITNILSQMANFVNSQNPRVSNPVNPNEDFADRWSMPQYKHLNLEQNFWSWLTQAQSDFEIICSSDNTQFISEQIMRKFSITVDTSLLAKKLGLSPATGSFVTPKKTIISTNPAGPWGTGVNKCII